METKIRDLESELHNVNSQMVNRHSSEVSSTEYISLKQKYESSVANYEKLNLENVRIRNERDKKTADYSKALEELKERHKQKVDQVY